MRVLELNRANTELILVINCDSIFLRLEPRSIDCCLELLDSMRSVMFIELLLVLKAGELVDEMLFILVVEFDELMKREYKKKN